MKIKVQPGDSILFRGMEGEVFSFLEKDLRNKTFGINFYSHDIYLEFKVTKNGYKTITGSPEFLINKTYRPKEFTVLFRPGTGKLKVLRKKQIKALIQKIHGANKYSNSKLSDDVYSSALFAIKLLEKI